MHDIKFIRQNPEAFDRAMIRRGIAPISEDILQKDEQYRKTLSDLQMLQAERKKFSRLFGQAKKTGENVEALQQKAITLREKISQKEEDVRLFEKNLNDALMVIPNILDSSVPEGKDETENKIIKTVGTPKEFDFTPKQHFDLGENLGMMDFETASKISGARFVILRGQLARLERALGQFMLDYHTEYFGYLESSVPLLVNDNAMTGTDKLPKFAEESFKTTDGRWLIPTGEVPLTASAMGLIMKEEDLPKRYVALTQCFRSEAGSAGRDVRGMLRQHQFTKCELVSMTTPEQSDDEHERMTQAAETILEALEIPYQRVLLCAGDTGFGAAKTYDLEAWMPGQQAWREVSSCSNTKDFQARRMNARYKKDKSNIFIHTLNGSGLAVGRVLIALMENHQTLDGSIIIPQRLRPYMNNKEIIKR